MIAPQFHKAFLFENAAQDGDRRANPPPRILVVDDDHEIRCSLSELLRLEGFDVETANNGWEAIAHVMQEPRPDLMILDLEMPVMNGWAVLDWLQTLSEEEAINVLVFSGTHGDEQSVAASPAMAKGTPPAALICRIKMLVDDVKDKR